MRTFRIAFHFENKDGNKGAGIETVIAESYAKGIDLIKAKKPDVKITKTVMRPIERIDLLKESVLKSIYDYCDSCYCGDDTKFDETIDIFHNGELIGQVYFWVSCEIDRWGEVDFVLQESEVQMLLSENSIPMPNVTKFLNKELIGHEGEILNY